MFYSLLPNGLFVFGSELKSIMTFPELSRELEPARGRGLFRLRLRAGAEDDFP
jgi:hypothetical protein